MDITWDQTVIDKFDVLISKIPVFLREIAKDKVSRAAETIAKSKNHAQVNEKDMVDAFFKETPFGFHGPLKSDMDELGLDYKQYGN